MLGLWGAGGSGIDHVSPVREEQEVIPKYLIIHHSAGPRDQSTEEIRTYHKMSRRFTDIGYHKIIEFDGRVKQGRADDESGAHAVGFNAKSLGICVVGNFDRYDLELNHPQWLTLVQACANLCKRHGIPAKNILFHRTTYKLRKVRVEKTCPGSRFPAEDLLQGTVGAYLKGTP